MKNKIAYFLIFLAFIVYLFFTYNNKLNIKYHNKIISNISDNYNMEYSGYIDIPKFEIKRVIKDGFSNNVLDHKYVGLKKINDNLTLLAGHNINLVFRKIHYLNKGDIVKIYLHDLKEYKVIKKVIVDINDYSYINKKYDEKTIILITCTSSKDKRLLVILKEN